MECYVTETSNKGSNAVAKPFGKSALSEKFLFVFGNQINVCLKVTMLGR